MFLIRLCLICCLLLPAPAVAATQPLLVFAASSLRQPFEELADLYQKRFRLPRPLLLFAGSQILRTQLQQGAPADIFASANQQVIDSLEAEQLISRPHRFAENRLALLVDKQNRQLKKLADLTRPGLLLAVGNQHVPVGRYTRELWGRLAADPGYGAELVRKIRQNIISEENSVKAIVTKVQLGEVDAGIVYHSELTAALRTWIGVIELPEQHNPTAHYPIAVTRRSTQVADAERFISLLLADEGQRILGKYHFQPAARETFADE